MSLPTSREHNRRVQQQEADGRRLDLLIASGCLEPEEQETFEDMRRELEGRKLHRRDATLSDKQRRFCDVMIRKLGLGPTTTFASGGIPEGRRVDHLDGVPGAFRKPLKPPPMRRA